MDDIEEHVKEPQDEQMQESEAKDRSETFIKNQNKEAETERRSHEDTESVKSGIAKQKDSESKSTASKLFVHSQWLSVQSSYFRALFYSGMKETFSKEVVMKIHEHELQAHLTLIEAMYKRDILNDKDYRLVVEVLVLANKYDTSHVVKKCKYVLLSTTPSLGMCEHTLKEISHLSGMVEIYDMLEKFLVKEFTPIDKTWTMEKFTELSKAAVKLLLGSDNLATQSENTIFVALTEWVRWNTVFHQRQTCDLLDVVRFEFMSADFLYDFVQGHYVAKEMHGFNKYLLKGLAYHGFSQNRKEQLDPKPKKRPVLTQDDDPTFSWVIDDELKKRLSESTGDSVFSNKFWCQGYQMKLHLTYGEDSSKYGCYLTILSLKDKACLNVSYRLRSNLFGLRPNRKSCEKLFTAKNSSWGFGGLELKEIEKEKSSTIDVWVKIG